MMYRKRSITFVLLAGLTVLINSCVNKQPAVELLFSKTTENFPSASAIEFVDNRLYVLGDDAPLLLVLDTTYEAVDSFRFINDLSYRINKETKPDIESVAYLRNNDENFLYALGSFSSPQRQELYYFPLSHPDSVLRMDFSELAKTLSILPELNIEGLAVISPYLVLANRANLTHKVNHLVILPLVKMQPDSIFKLLELQLDTSTIKGISGLYHHAERDVLFFTASEEETFNAIDDGKIKDSYIGWIENFRSKWENDKIQPDGMIKLSTVDKEFAGQKLESVCVQSHYRDKFVLHLAADNDKGQSKFFRISVQL